MQVVYAEAQVAPAQGGSPSAAKPRPVVEAWRSIDPSMVIVAPERASRLQLERAHDPDYVDDVLALRAENGFGTRSRAVADSLPYTSGAMLTAARLARAQRAFVAAPVSGFHHAGYDFGGGFCTFNGLCVAALALLEEDRAARVGILDYDYHHGNGTVDILRRLGERRVEHESAGARWTHPSQAEDFLAQVPATLDRFAGCDVVLYQAGADPHVDDPLGGFLTGAQLARRDALVFDGLARRGIPCAWNLAGGYQEPLSKVIAIHVATYRAARAASPSIA